MMEGAIVDRPIEAVSRVSERALARLALAAVTALAFAVRFAAFDRVPGNPYYDAAVRSMSLSWHNFFYGAFEPGAQVSIDKAPADLWLQVLSTKLIGFSSVGLRMPEALAGALAVPLLYDLVRRLFGRGAGLASALVLALLPAAVLTARSDTMDSLMMALIVLAAWLLVRGAQDRRSWHVGLAGIVMGLAFNVKLFEALVALPALVLLGAMAADLPLRSRLLHLSDAALGFVMIGLSWVVLASIAPLGERPYPIGSTNGGVWNVAFVFNGLNRAHQAGPATDPPLAEPPGPLRLLGTEGRDFGALIGVLIVPAVILGVLALVERAARRKDARRQGDPSQSRLRRAGATFVAVWLAGSLVTFSAMRLPQVRYLEAMTPAIAAAAGIAVAVLASAARRRVVAALLLAAGAVATSLIAPSIDSHADWVPSVALGSALLTVSVALLHGIPATRRLQPALSVVLAIGALAAILAVPLARTLAIAGSSASSSQLEGRMDPLQLERLSTYLRAHQGTARYEVASTTVTKVAPLIIRDARPVLMLTSYQGRPLLTPAQLEQAVHAGLVRYLLVGRGLCPLGAPPSCQPLLSWARSHSTDVSAEAGLTPGTLAQLHTQSRQRG
ncbi:MAG TPA: glycosyltransferase family 39 protein [Solirubrobacteraceae bacterium]|nr:glycosyltransferase family 39 protein [Solirubrobacteraceae bacterium]